MEVNKHKEVNQKVDVNPPVKGPEPLLAESKLSATQKQRIAYLSPVYNGSTEELVSLIEPRGRNSWRSVNDKIDAIRQADNKDQRYNEAIDDEFDLQTVYSSDEIISKVASVRREENLPSYGKHLRSKCEQDFFNLFIVKEVYEPLEELNADGQPKRKLVGYKPVFRLIPEDKE